MKISIRHQLSIGIEPGAARAALHLLLTPQDGPTQSVKEWALDVEGLDEPDGIIDGYGNRAHLVTQTHPESEIVVTLSGLVETRDGTGVVGRGPADPAQGLFLRKTDLTSKVPARLTSGLAEMRDDRIAMLHLLMERVGDGSGGSTQSQSQSQDGGSQSQSQGQPQEVDFVGLVHAFIGAARALEVPTRYVTGYLAAMDDQPAAFHAWADAWDDKLGWIAFDPMLQLCPTDRHVRLASGLDALSTMPARAVPAAGEPKTLSLSVEAQP